MIPEEINNKLNWLDLVCNMYATGKEIYEACKDSMDSMPDAEIIVSPANLGDTVFISSLASAYKKAHGVGHLMIMAKKRQAEAAEWFEGVDNVIGIENDEMICLRYYFTISRKFYENRIRYGHIPCNIDWTEPGAFYHVPPGFGGMPLIRVWENRILDLPEGSPLGNIRVPEGVRGENAERFRNAVLIAPAAFTNKGIPDSFWEKLAAALRKEGFDVYCNSGGLSYDKIIEGTTEYVSSTKELIVNAPLFRHVIGVRSGFTDLVAKTGARMSVLHLGGGSRWCGIPC